jgi:preprotein translocase SecF subunit
MVDVFKYRWISAVMSLVIASAFIGTYVYKDRTRGSAFRYSVDFTGGTEVLFKFSKPVSSSEIVNILKKDVTVREFSPKEIGIRVKDYSNDATGLAESMRLKLEAGLSETTIETLQSEFVGPGVGEELRWKSIKAILFALIAMLAYIAFRFWSFAFAVGAVVALFHDAVVMLAVFLLFDREISINVIGAILAVMGYSINDTIVIFSQIRDELKKAKKDVSLKEIINVGVSHTLKRTMLTSISTALTVGSMFVLGGDVLRDFSLALFVGIVFGTYSSIFIASPIMKLLYKKVRVS